MIYGLEESHVLTLPPECSTSFIVRLRELHEARAPEFLTKFERVLVN